MSGEEGTATLTLFNRDMPFQSEEEQLQTANLQYEFKPPHKAYDSDIHARSGGEKTIAALALIFALA